MGIDMPEIYRSPSSVSTAAHPPLWSWSEPIDCTTWTPGDLEQAAVADGIDARTGDGGVLDPERLSLRTEQEAFQQLREILRQTEKLEARAFSKPAGFGKTNSDRRQRPIEFFQRTPGGAGKRWKRSVAKVARAAGWILIASATGFGLIPIILLLVFGIR